MQDRDVEEDTAEESARAAAGALPGVFMTEQWGGLHVYKVGTPERFRMFAVLAPGQARMTVKLPEDSARLLLEAEVAERNVHLPRGGWVNLRLDRLDSADVAERIAQSYELCAAALPKRIRAALK